MRRLLLTVAMTAAVRLRRAAEDAGDAVRPITLLTQPQAAAPQEYQAAEIIADAWRKLGLTVNVRPLAGPAVQSGHLVRAPALGRHHLADGRQARAQRSG